MTPTPLPDNKDFKTESMYEKKRPCKQCVMHCIEDPNNFCAMVVSRPDKQQCTRCSKLRPEDKKGGCVPFPGVTEEMDDFIYARNQARRFPGISDDDFGPADEFEAAGHALQMAILRQTYAKTIVDKDQKAKETGHVSSLPLRLANENDATLTRLRMEEAELDIALEIARLKTSISKKRAQVEAAGQKLPDSHGHAPASSSDHPAKRQKTQAPSS